MTTDARQWLQVIGLDLGKQSDPSALALLRWDARQEAVPKPRVYQVPMLKRWPLGTPYLEIVAAVLKLYQTPGFLPPNYPILVVDATGVGVPVCEMVKEQLTRANAPGGMVGVTITGGRATTHVGEGQWHVAKKTLVSVLQVLLGNRRLQVAQGLAEAATLVRELGTFQVKLTEVGNESFDAWRTKDTDDLVLAVALACWAAETLDCFKPVAAEVQGPLYLAV